MCYSHYYELSIISMFCRHFHLSEPIRKLLSMRHYADIYSRCPPALSFLRHLVCHLSASSDDCRSKDLVDTRFKSLYICSFYSHIHIHIFGDLFCQQWLSVLFLCLILPFLLLLLWPITFPLPRVKRKMAPRANILQHPHQGD